MKTFCLIRFSGLQVLGKEDSGYRVMYENNPHTITAVQIAELLPRLAWLDELPLVPLRLAQIGKHNAVAADLTGVPFADYLACDNLYTGYLQTQQNDLLREMAAILYKASDITLTDEEAISVFYWFASLKAYYQRRFSYLFSTEPTQGDNLLTPMQTTEQRLQTAMDNQIRALTKGDVTKETEVLNTDTLRALTELYAMAREYQDLERESKK
ncbi:MAG: hypothetical protein IJU35_02040 [Paludibacteraceae bacterium]|nr:hypothetical protein [Paludibacteraceae bacterium]